MGRIEAFEIEKQKKTKKKNFSIAANDSCIEMTLTTDYLLDRASSFPLRHKNVNASIRFYQVSVKFFPLGHWVIQKLVALHAPLKDLTTLKAFNGERE